MIAGIVSGLPANIRRGLLQYAEILESRDGELTEHSIETLRRVAARWRGGPRSTPLDPQDFVTGPI